MTTSERLQADYLTCSQCTNPFHQPKTLPCLHNFCKACLGTYLENEMSGGRSTTFNCPDCREKIYVPDPSKAVARWASQFPTNFILTGMIEAIAEEAGGEGQDGEKVKAAKERRGGRGDDHSPSRSSGDLDSPDGRSEPDASSSLQERLANVQDSVQKESSELSYYLRDIRSTHEDQKKRLEMSFGRVQDLIELRKVQLLEELEQNFTEERDRIQQAKQSSKHDSNSLNSCAELLKGMEEKSLSKGVASDMLEAIQQQVSEIEIRPTKLISRTVKFEQKLEAGRSILNLIENLGSVTITTAGEVDRQNDDGENGEDSNELFLGEGAKIFAKPRFLTAISSKHGSGQHQQIHAITVMPSGNVIMTSYGANVIQAAKNYGNQYKIFSRLELNSEPKCLVTISPHYVAVVGKFCIYIIGVTAEKLILKQTVQTGKSYTGIAAYSESSLILTCQSPPSVDFVGLNGFISETIDKDLTTNTILFKKPHFITTSKDGTIYVSDHSSVPKLLGINNAGKVKFSYPGDGSQGFDAIQGVACDSLGHIYIVDRGTKTVVLLTPTGEKVKDILTSKDGLTDPCAIAIDKDDHMYVTNDFSEVLVFQTR